MKSGKPPEAASVVMHLELSHPYAQILTLPVTIFSNMTYRIERKTFNRK
jgi:hypothetical protein